jgi:hypothetical protein
LVKSLLAIISVMILASCAQKPSDRVDPADYEAFWLWAGVMPQPVLARAKTVYLLSGEVRRESGTFVNLRPATPRLGVPNLWLVVRVDTLRWKQGTTARLKNEVSRWRAGGNNVRGVQIDFDARTRHLDEYARFLQAFRSDLSPSTRLSVTGLMDWGVNGDPIALGSLKGVVDEMVIQTYQGRQTVPNYEKYIGRLSRLSIPFKIGLVQGGEWRADPSLKRTPHFRGYVVFLVNSSHKPS